MQKSKLFQNTDPNARKYFKRTFCFLNNISSNLVLNYFWTEDGTSNILKKFLLTDKFLSV